MKITLTTDDVKLKSRIAKVKGKVSSSDLALVGGIAVTELIRKHVADIAVSRHKTAMSLGATPTQHYKTQLVDEPVVTGNSADIGINIKGISRAYKDMHIRPVKAKALTIPIHAMAYGVRVAELKARGIEVFRPKGTDILAMAKSGKEKGFIPLYTLKSYVNIKQDPTLMPTDNELLKAFSSAIKDTLDLLDDNIK